ncbi:MAG TPA: DAHL domain-containing protein, partial [Gallionella sp.]|nr:DAHL domain-containing protein [Gallionella sp.]
MRLASKTKFGGVVVVLVLLGWLFQQSDKGDTEQHVRTIEHFRQIKQLDATLNQYVLQSRYDLLNNYDPIVQTQQQIDALLADIERDTQLHFAAPESPLHGALARYREAIKNKAESIEQFKSHNAVFKNSLHYFPIVVHALLDSGQGDVQRGNLLHGLLDDVLLYSHSAVSQDKELISSRLAKILQQANGNRDELQSLSTHVGVILSHKDEIDEQMRQITSAPTDVNGDELFGVYNRQFMRETAHAARYKQMLALLALALVGYVTWAMARL